MAVDYLDGRLAPEAKAEHVALVADSFKLDKDKARAAQYLQNWSTEELQQAFLRPLSFERTVLFQQLPGEPAQGAAKDKHETEKDRQRATGRPEPMR